MQETHDKARFHEACSDGAAGPIANTLRKNTGRLRSDLGTPHWRETDTRRVKRVAIRKAGARDTALGYRSQPAWGYAAPCKIVG
jgi:hypothetical protein